MAEVYKSEQAQISGVEKEALEKKKEELKSTLASKHDIFFSQASEAGKLFVQAETSVSHAKGKEQIRKDKEAIRGHLVQVVEKGRTVLAAEESDKGHPALAGITSLASSISGFVERAKTEIPIYLDIEKASGLFKKAQPQVKDALKYSDPKERKKLKPAEVRGKLNDALSALADPDVVLMAYRPEAFPSETPQKLLLSVRNQISQQMAEIAAIALLVREGAEKEDPELNKLDTANQAYEKSKSSTKQMTDLKEKILDDQAMTPATFKDRLTKMNGAAGAAFDELVKVHQQLKQIKMPEGLAPHYQTLFRQLLFSANADLQEISDVKLYCATYSLVQTGQMNQYFKFNADGTVEETTAFKGLDTWTQQELLTRLRSLPIQIQLELDEKMAIPEEKHLIEGKKKMAGGDWIGAKADLLLYYNETADKEGLDQSRIGETKELLKQIAKLEIAQCAGRIQAMRDSISGRYEWGLDPGGKTGYGTHNKHEAELYLEDMSYLLVEAEQMIERGEVLTIGDAEVKLRKSKGSLQTSAVALHDQLLELKKKDPNDEELKKKREKSIADKRVFLGSRKEQIARALRGEPEPLTGEYPTPEHIRWLHQQYRMEKAEVEGLEAMTAKDYHSYLLANTQQQYNSERARSALVRFNSGFNGAADVFDVFRQQRVLNNPDQKAREEGMLKMAKEAREKGLPGLARVYYDMIFSKELEEESKHLSKVDVLKEFIADEDNRERIAEQIKEWKEDFAKKAGRPPTEEEADTAQGQMVQFMVEDAYSKKIKSRVHRNFQGKDSERAQAWMDAYGGLVAVQEIEGAGMFEGLWTDESWNELPAKVAITTAIIIVSIETAGAATTLLAPSSTAIALLGNGAVGRVAGWGLDLAVESLVFTSTEGALNGVIQGDWSTFSGGGSFLHSWGHTALTLGLLKGVGGGINKLRVARGKAAFGKATEEEAARLAYMPKGIGAYADDALWWATRTAAESTALTSMAWAQSKLSGKPFGARDAFRAFGENVVFSAAIAMGHRATGKEGAAPEKPKTAPERAVASAAQKAVKAERMAKEAEAAAEKFKKRTGSESQKLRERADSYRKAAEEASKELSQKAETAVQFDQAIAKVAEVAQKADVDYSNPETIKTARVDADGTVIINGKAVKGFTVELLSILPPAVRGRVIQLVENQALDTNFQSRVTSEVPKELLPDPTDPSSGKKVHGWVDALGRIHFNMTHLNEGYVGGREPESAYREAPPKKILPEGYRVAVAEGSLEGTGLKGSSKGKKVTIKAGETYIIGPEGPVRVGEFLRTPEGAELRGEMVRIKNHEATHQVLEYAYTKEAYGEDGLPMRVEDPAKTKPLLDLFAQPDATGHVPEGKIALVDQNGRPREVNWRNVQEYLCHVSDGSISASDPQRRSFESAIQGQAKGFTFDKARVAATRLLAGNAPRAFAREFMAAKEAAEGPAVEIGGIDIRVTDMKSFSEALLSAESASSRRALYEMYIDLISFKGKEGFSDLLAKYPHIRPARKLVQMAGQARDLYAKEYDSVSIGFAEARRKKSPSVFQSTDTTGIQRAVLEAIKSEAIEVNRSLMAGPEATIVLEGRIKDGNVRLGQAVVEIMLSSERGRALLGKLSSEPAIKKQIEGRITKLYESALKNHGDKIMDLVMDLALQGKIDPEAMDLLGADAKKILPEDVVDLLLIGSVTPESIRILKANMDAPEFNADYATRIATTAPEIVVIGGQPVQYYPNVSVGEGGVGTFFKVGILDPATGKLSFAGAKVAHSGDLGTEVRGVNHILQALRAHPDAAKLFAEPLSMADDGSLIFYEVVERNGKTRDLDKAIEDPSTSPSDICSWTTDSFRALAFLHSQGILHGDFKGLQVFIGESGAQLGDFGTVVPFTKYVENGGWLVGQTATREGSPIFHMPVSGGGKELVWFGKLPNYDAQYGHAPISGPYYSGDVYDVVQRNGPAYAWKIDAYSAGVHLEQVLTGKVYMQKARFNSNHEPEKIPGEFVVEDAGHKKTFGDARDAQLLEIARRLKDPNNLTYTMDDAVRDMVTIRNP